MKATYKNIALAALALSAVACSQDEDFTSAYLSDTDAVRITAQVGDISSGFTRSNPIEDEQKTFNSGDKIGVSAGSQAAVVYTFDADGKTWNPETDKYLKWESNSMNFTAWYPATGNTDAKNFIPQYNATVETDADTHLTELQANDYMTYSGEQNNTNGNGVNLTMERQMVRIVISKIDYNDEYNADDNAVVAIAITSGSNKYESGTWKDGSTTAQMYKHDGNWYAVLPPTATAKAKANETFLSITLNGVREPLIVKGIPATEAGKSYDYTLTVGKNVATIGSVSVTDWLGGTILGGEAEAIYNIKYNNDKTAAIVEFYKNPEARHISDAIEQIYKNDGVTDIVVTSALTADQQSALATALSEKTVTLYLPKVSTTTAFSNGSDITVICGVATESAAKGDAAMLDGSFIAIADLDKLSPYLKSQVAGIVFWTCGEEGSTTLVGDAAADKIMKVDHPNCTHGLIVALRDTKLCQWQKSNELIFEFQESDLFNPNYKPDYVTIRTGISETDNLNKILGYNNTKVLEAYNKYCLANNKNDNIVIPVIEINNWKESNPAPANATDWFLPSAKELHLLCYKDTKVVWQTYGTDTRNIVDASIGAVGGDKLLRSNDTLYWSSSEAYSDGFICSLRIGAVNAFLQGFTRSTEFWVRAVCAF